MEPHSQLPVEKFGMGWDGMEWGIPTESQECCHSSPGPLGSSPALLGSGLVARLRIARDGRGAQGVRAAPGAWKRRKPFGSQVPTGIDPEPWRRQNWGIGITILRILGLIPAPGWDPQGSGAGIANGSSFAKQHPWKSWNPGILEWTLNPILFRGQGYFPHPRQLQATSKLSLDVPGMRLSLSGHSHSQIQTIPAPGTAPSQTSPDAQQGILLERGSSQAFGTGGYFHHFSIIFPSLFCIICWDFHSRSCWEKPPLPEGKIPGQNSIRMGLSSVEFHFLEGKKYSGIFPYLKAF